MRKKKNLILGKRVVCVNCQGNAPGWLMAYHSNETDICGRYWMPSLQPDNTPRRAGRKV